MLNYLFHWVIPLRSELKKMGGNKEGNIKTDTQKNCNRQKYNSAQQTLT